LGWVESLNEQPVVGQVRLGWITRFDSSIKNQHSTRKRGGINIVIASLLEKKLHLNYF